LVVTLGVEHVVSNSVYECAVAPRPRKIHPVYNIVTTATRLTQGRESKSSIKINVGRDDVLELTLSGNQNGVAEYTC
jgi:hypothetical protein